MRDREAMLTPASWVALSYTSAFAKELYGTVIKFTRVVCKSTRFLGVHLQEDLDRVGNFVASRMIADNNYFFEIEKEIKRRENILLKLFYKLNRIDYKKETTHRLIELAQEMMRKNSGDF